MLIAAVGAKRGRLRICERPYQNRWMHRHSAISEQIIMKARLLLSVVATAIVTFSSTAVIAYAATQPVSFRGNAVSAGIAVDQVIVVTDATRYVNVVGGSTVRFVVGEQSFTWSFQNGSAHVLPFDLATIAPQGLLKHPVTAYVSDNPLYQGT
jgi:hypothetical protein